jgi:hypothetical protein
MSDASGGTAGSSSAATGGIDSGAAGVGETVDPPTAEPISYTRVEQEVFEPAGCTAGYCHGGSAGDLTWSYDALVSTAAKPVCGLTERVVPFDPEASVLWARVQPADPAQEPCAKPMPEGGPPLTPEQAQLVYDWIAGGAAP